MILYFVFLICLSLCLTLLVVNIELSLVALLSVSQRMQFMAQSAIEAPVLTQG